MPTVNLRYTNAAARIAVQANIAGGLPALDIDTGKVFLRTATGWLPMPGHPAIQSNGPTTVAAAGSTDLAIYDVGGGARRMMVEISVATQALDGFIIYGRAHPSASYQTLYSISAQYNSPSGLLVGTSGDLTAIAAGASGWFIMDVEGIESVKIAASAALDSAAVTTRATVS